MKKIESIIKSKILRYTAFALAGLLLGWLLFSTPGQPVTPHDHDHEAHKSDAAGVWTCSMHPQIRQDKPGKCPICAMDLIPLKQGSSSSDLPVGPQDIQMSAEAAALADVQTTVVSRTNPVKTIRLYGKIAPDERNLQSQTAHIAGRIEKLNVDFTGETVRRGQTLATIYSPELLTAQQELIEAVRNGQQPIVEAAREKLRLWKLTDAQIAAIERSGQVSPTMQIKANASGIVISRRVSQGDYVSQGAVLFDVADLSTLWAMFDAYETDLPFLNKGDQVQFTLQALPGKTFKGKIAFIDPIINSTTRTAGVRVETANPGLEMKPEMYATAQVSAPLKGLRNEIVVPQSAVLWTGKRSVVYVKQPHGDAPVFRMREVELGPSLGGAYVVLNGLADGEAIVTNGVFSVDASAQLEGKRSMMNPTEAKPATGHEGHTVNGNTQQNEHRAVPAGEHAMFHVGGACGMCKERIEQTAGRVKGVISANWEQEKQQLHLQYNPGETSPEAVEKALAAIGHDAGKFKAPQAVYDALPACCHYRK